MFRLKAWTNREGLKNIRQSLQSFIDVRSKLEAKVKRVLQANDSTLLITEWSINGTKPDGKPINLTGRGTVILTSAVRRKLAHGNRESLGDRLINE